MTDRRRCDAEDVAFDLLASGADALSDPGATGPCPGPNEIAGMVDGGLTGTARAAVESHVSCCAACRRLVGAILSLGVGDAAENDAVFCATTAAGSPPPPAEAGFPRVFGPYLLRRRVGGGGMGDVFEAEHRERGRREALKILRAGLDGDPRAAERFLREVRAAAGLSHEHVVPVFDSGSVDGVPYYTMPLLPGPSLAQVTETLRSEGASPLGPAAGAVLDRCGLAAAPVPSDDAATACARRFAGAIAGVAAALAEIHGRGMVHRDVKPSNLVLDAHGQALLTDFGLVRVDGSGLTRTAESVGTPAFVAPEQLLAGSEVDGRADVYSLGATLYELVTLRRPFQEATVAATVAAILRGEVQPACDANPAVPRDLGVILGRCLERRPEDRYANARTLAADLTAFSRGDPIGARPVSRVRRAGRWFGRHARAVAVAAAVLAAASAVAYFRPGRIVVRSLPPASVVLDGSPLGSTPLGPRDARAGHHRIELRRDGFVPLDRAFVLERGSTWELDAVLRAVDPADSASLALLAAARGVERSEVDLSPKRSAGGSVKLAVLFPRGALRSAPLETTLWADVGGAELSLRLERTTPGAPASELHAWTVAPARRQARLELPGPALAALTAGTYRLSVSSGSDEGLSAEFTILDAAQARSVVEALDAATRGFDADDPAAEFLRADLLLSRGLLVEALATAARARQSVGDRREVARVVLSALERAGLRDVGPWIEWAALHLRSER